MNTIDLTPLYRNSIGYDRFANLLNSALTTDPASSGYPPYDIEIIDENRYAIVLAVAGFSEDELDIKVEKGVLIVGGNKADEEARQFLHHGIGDRPFERKFHLADYVDVTGAELRNGLLKVSLVKEIPEAMKPKTIAINQANEVIEHEVGKKGGKAA